MGAPSRSPALLVGLRGERLIPGPSFFQLDRVREARAAGCRTTMVIDVTSAGVKGARSTISFRSLEPTPHRRRSAGSTVEAAWFFA
jgi:hypothetical protein